MLWIILAVLIALGLFAVYAFNRLRRVDIGAQEALGGIDVQLTRRADLIPNLVNTVKGYAEHEKGVFETVTAARAGAANAAKSGTVAEKAAAEATLDHAIIDVLAVAEAYPDLRASANFQALQTELSDTENKISFARQYYNDAVSTLNRLVRTIPWLLFAGVAGVGAREFYAAPDGQQVPPAVTF
ncbi:LemA family protein [Aeromicrobium sp.]|uniref:LemA family protein n=1 Tax=Aeromicrobium sp. TaxID=1871063 RepID=UPI003C3F9A7A